MNRSSRHSLGYSVYPDKPQKCTEPELQIQADAAMYAQQLPEPHFQESADDQDDGDDQSEVPSMTRGSSSRSASSSIIICPSCENSSEKCQCQYPHLPAGLFSQMDFESVNNISRTHSPAAVAQHATARKIAVKSLLKYDSASSPHISSNTIGKFAFLTPLSTIAHQNDLTPRNGDCAPAKFVRSRDNVFYNDRNIMDDSDDEDEDSDEDEEEGQSDSFSDRDGELEAIVLRAVGGDLELAADLIPIFHKSFYTDSMANVAQKVDLWYNAINKYSPGTSGGQTPSLNTQSPRDGNGNPRKRHRGVNSDEPNRGSNEDDIGDDEDEDDNEDSKGMRENGDGGGEEEGPRLACPFHKKDPAKYDIQHNATEVLGKTQYRTCAGPGFTSIQRLKEHLKRKHYPVQCDRCYHIFPGKDRARCVIALETHRQMARPCDRREAGLKEGISDAQWAQLDKKKSAKQVKSLSRVEKYFEIWAIIFPDIQKPRTPWYDNQKVAGPLPHSSESQRYAEIFSAILERQVLDRQIRFAEGEEQEMKARVSAVAQQAFSIYSRLSPVPLSSNSSSSRSHQRTSLLSGSYTNISTPVTTSGGHRLYGSSRSSSALNSNRHLSMDSISTPPTRSQMAAGSGGPNTVMGPPQGPSVRHLQQSFANMQSQPQAISTFSPMTIPPNYPQFQNYANNNSGPDPFDQPFGSQFGSPASNFNAVPPFDNFADVSRQILDPSMIDPAGSGAQNLESEWPEMEFDPEL